MTHSVATRHSIFSILCTRSGTSNPQEMFPHVNFSKNEKEKFKGKLQIPFLRLCINEWLLFPNFVLLFYCPHKISLTVCFCPHSQTHQILHIKRLHWTLSQISTQSIDSVSFPTVDLLKPTETFRFTAPCFLRINISIPQSRFQIRTLEGRDLQFCPGCGEGVFKLFPDPVGSFCIVQMCIAGKHSGRANRGFQGQSTSFPISDHPRFACLRHGFSTSPPRFGSGL